MKRLLLILSFTICWTWGFAQDGTRVVDSLENVLAIQQGNERIKTMIQMVWAFYDVSFDDGIEWGEKAMSLAHESGEQELEAQAAYALGMQFGYHNDLDLAQDYLKKAYDLYEQAGNDPKAFDALWNIAYFELVLGNMDSALTAYQEVLAVAERGHDTLASAQTLANLAVIHFQLDDFNASIEALKSSRRFYVLLNDSANLAQTDFNLATLYGEYGMIDEARKLYVAVIPRLKAFRNYDFLLLAYKNYGLLFERDLVNYDSACYYFEKSLEVTAMEDLSRQDRQTMSNTKADVLTELGNVALERKEFQQAMDYYEEAMALGESNRYHFGQMQAAVGLGHLYAQQGQAAKSLQYLERYAEEASSSGITMMEHSVRKSMILNYARLGRFAEMGKELETLDEQRASLLRENVDLYDQISSLQDETQWLLSKYETQNTKIQTLQSQRNRYRLAFFGLLSIVLFVVVLFVAYKIVRKNRTKVE